MITKFSIFAIAFLSTHVLASPTAEDFQHCHRMTAVVLEECLNENPGSQNTTRCFKEASGVLSICVAELKSTHSVKRREAEKAIARSHANRLDGEPSTQRGR